jgi:hypothetical protein
MTRIKHNGTGDKREFFTVNISHGNVWHPPVNGLIPSDPVWRNTLSEMAWHSRYFWLKNRSIELDGQNTFVNTDGVFRSYNISGAKMIRNNLQLVMDINGFSLDGGGLAIAPLTSDQPIEWFHSNVKGGEDPFARKDYGYNHAFMEYSDKNGNSLSLSSGDFRLTNSVFTLYYFPTDIPKINVQYNIGVITGINHNRVYPSLDFGLDLNSAKTYQLNNKTTLQITASIGLLRKKLIGFGEGLNVFERDFLFDHQSSISIIRTLKKGRQISFGTSYRNQTSYFKPDGFNHIVIQGDGLASTTHHGLTHLYTNLSAHSFMLTYSTPRWQISTYGREDFILDNAPDIQTGTEFTLYLDPSQ